MAHIDLSSYEPVNGVTNDGNPIAAAFQVLQALLNGQLDSTNISPTAGIPLSALAPGGLAKIFDSTLLVAAASFDVTSIPATYANLLIEAQLRGTTAASNVNCYVQFNGDTAGNYDLLQGVMSGTTASAATLTGQAQLQVGAAAASTAGTGFATSLRATIENYAGTTFHKAGIFDIAHKEAATSASLTRYSSSGFWRSAAAINEVKVFPSAGNWDIGSRLVVYGIG